MGRARLTEHLRFSYGPSEGRTVHLRPAKSYLSKLRRDSVGADFQSVRKLTNYVCAKPPESRLSHFHNVYNIFRQYPRYGGYGY